MGDMIVGTCWNCGRPLGKADFGRESECPACTRSTRVCRNCGNFAPGRPNQCLEPMAERVLDKERANFCEWFEPTREPLRGDAHGSADDLRKAAEALFK
jgi:hypothetical protein